jgi:hypothetical protein
MPHYMFCARKKIICRTFRIGGTLVFLCPYTYVNIESSGSSRSLAEDKE